MGWFPEQPGGLNRYVYELTHQLAPISEQVELCYAHHQQPLESTEFWLTSLACATSPLVQRLWQTHQQFQHRHIQHPDAVNLHLSLYSWPILNQIPEGIPITFTFHGPWASEGQREAQNSLGVQAKRWFEQQVYGKCHRFIVLSQAFGQILHCEYGVPWHKIHVIPGGINTRHFQANLSRAEARARMQFPSDRLILFTPRRLVQRMGIDKLLEALVGVKQEIPDIWLAIAGKGPQRHRLEQQVEALGLNQQVRFLGYVPDEDLPLCYQAADLTVVPSQSLEGFGLILLESLASGTPVLSTPVGGMPEVLRPFDVNLVTENKGVKGIGDRLIQLLLHPDQLPSRADCRTYAVEHFDWHLIAPRIQKVLLQPVSS